MRLVVLIFLLLPGAALADPVSVFGAVGTFLGSAAVTIGTFAISWGQIVFATGALLYGQASQRKQQKAAADAARQNRDAHNAALRDKTISGISTEFPWRYVYGTDRVGVNVVAVLTSGSRDEYKHLVCVIAQQESEDITDIYINGTLIGPLNVDGDATSGPFVKTDTLDGYQESVSSAIVLTHTPIIPSNPVTGNLRVVGYRQKVDEFGNTLPGEDFEFLAYSYNSGTNTITAIGTGFLRYSVSYQYYRLTSTVTVRKHLGVPSAVVDPLLNALLPSAWPTTATLQGHTYIYMRLNINQPEFQSGLPAIEVRLKGKKIYDPRTGLTVWSENPALVAMDYLTSRLGGVPYADLPEVQYIAAANDCDDIVSTGGWSGKRFTFNGSVTSDASREQTLEAVAQSMCGGIVATSWDIWAGKWHAPIMALDQSDIVGDLAFSPGFSQNEVFNTVVGQYASLENKDVVTDYKPYTNAVYLALDGERLETNLDLLGTNAQQRCTNIARIVTESNRNAFSMNGTFSLKTWKLRVGDRVTFTSAVFGQVNKIYRLTDRTCGPGQFMQLGFKEDAASIYDLADETQADATPNTNLPNLFVLPPLESLTLSSGTDTLFVQADGTIVSRIFVQWPPTVAPSVVENGWIEVQYKKVTDTDWAKVTVAGDQVSTYLAPVADSLIYSVRARVVNPYINTPSDWTYAPIHAVVGKTELPPDILDLSISGAILTWTPVVAIDLAGYVLRFHYGISADWGSAVPLHTGLILASPFDMVTRPGGTVTILIKAVDFSGNLSKNAGVVVTDLGEPPIANIVETIDLAAMGFPGTVEGGSLESGGLVADALDSFYGTDNQSFYGLDTEPFYDLSAYGQMVYTTDEIHIDSALAGSILSILIESQGVDLVIEYRLSGPGSFYGADMDSFYGLDADPFYGPAGSWVLWPGQVLTENESYQFRFTVGAGAEQGIFSEIVLVVDAPDIVEYLSDVLVSAAGTVVPYTKNFTEIKTVTPTLQANGSGAITVETDKTINLAPVLKAYNSSHVAVSGASVDIIIKGR